MGFVNREFSTLLSGVSHLIEQKHFDEAEQILKEICDLAGSHGNTAEKEITRLSLIEFLRSQGRQNEADLIASQSPVPDNTPRAPAIDVPAAKKLVVIGSGAGGVEAVCVLLNNLPSTLEAAVLVVQHIPGHSPTELGEMLNRRSALPVLIPEDGALLLPAHVYLAPSNQHLMVRGNFVLLGNGPKENRARPAIDVLFRTAAHAYGSNVIGVILSGVLNDGTAGLMAIKIHGGKSLVQSADEAVFDGMPGSAIALTDVDHIARAAELGKLVGSLITEFNGRADSGGTMHTKNEPDNGEVGGPGIHDVAPYPPSALTCPSCGGAVWQIQQQSLTLFKCHTGHSYTAELMLEEQSEAVDAAAWTLLRSVNEQIELRKKLAEWSRATGRVEESKFHEQQAKQAEKQSVAFRKLLLSNEKGRD